MSVIKSSALAAQSPLLSPPHFPLSIPTLRAIPGSLIILCPTLSSWVLRLTKNPLIPIPSSPPSAAVILFDPLSSSFLRAGLSVFRWQPHFHPFLLSRQYAPRPAIPSPIQFLSAPITVTHILSLHCDPAPWTHCIPCCPPAVPPYQSLSYLHWLPVTLLRFSHVPFILPPLSVFLCPTLLYTL